MTPGLIQCVAALSLGFMKICYYYWLIEPLRSEYRDDSENEPASSVNIYDEHETYTLSLFLDEQGEPYFARFTIPNLAKECIPEHLQPLLHEVKEHLISVLKVTWRGSASIFRFSIWHFQDPNEAFSMGWNLEEVTDSSFRVDQMKDVFVSTFSERHVLRLFVNGIDSGLPLQYRFLALYKIIEDRFKSKGSWNYDELNTFLSKYQFLFEGKGVKKKPKNYIHDIRDRCSHVRTGSVLGVTDLNSELQNEVRSILPVMSSMCCDLVNEMGNGDFEIGHPNDFEPPNWDRM